MTALDLFNWVDDILAIPFLILCVSSGIFFTFKTRFAQIRLFSHFISLLCYGVKQHHQTKNEKSIRPFQAVFTAMATTIGMGNIVGPSIAIVTGGPGALFWLIAYSFLGSITKFTEVIFGVTMRTRLKDGTILGGPTQYLKTIHASLADWYGILTIFLFAGWSGMQANTLAHIFYKESVARWQTGLILASFVFVILLGGIKRIGALASNFVPIMFVLYVGFVLSILCSDPQALFASLKLMCSSAFSSQAAIGGFLGTSLITAMRIGVHRNMHITEAGLGTASIAHSMADTDKPSDQAVLAMFSIIADTTLAFLSGLLVLVSGQWVNTTFSTTMVYEIFKNYSPGMGKWVLLTSVTLFVITTVIGNSFNASQSFIAMCGTQWIKAFYIMLAIVIFAGSLLYVELLWRMMDVIQMLVAIPHIIGLFILTFTHGKFLKL